jgi:hypothetical protein
MSSSEPPLSEAPRGRHPVAAAVAEPPAAEAARVPPTPCANCGAATTGHYCAECGQEVRDQHLSLPRLLHEFTEEYLNLDSRVIRSLGHLLFRPGFLTQAYVQGRRQRYVRPFRLYLVASILFFTVATLSLRSSFIGAISVGPEVDDWFTEEFGLGGAGGEAEGGDAAGGEPADAPAATPGAGSDAPAVAPGPGSDARAAAAEGAEREAGASAGTDQDAAGAPARLSFEERLKRRAGQIGERGVSSFVQSAAQQFWSDLPKLMFVLLPFFALFLKVLYLRRGRSYVEHFIFSLHTHSFVFIVFTALVLLRQVPHAGWLAASIPLYVFLAQKRVYGQGFLKRSVKYLLLGSAYFTAVVLALVMTVLLILFLV